MSALARVDALTLRLGERTLFQGWSAEVPAGITLVCGDEGTGKSTLLRLLAGVLRPQAGRVEAPPADQVFWVDAFDPALDPVPARALLERWTAPFPARKPWGDGLAALDLLPHLDKPMYMLSTGSRRKVGLAAALASGARLVLLDQPFAGLDLPSERVVCQWLARLADRPDRACVVADYLPPRGVALAAVLDLDTLPLRTTG
ncbi:ABC transporter ATP-binding protein [Macromonas nakdongensis]|uniref:ABC transporter ATP-binding protein n=1 Tax=Macromonas nakdongensis TaxID=1843082 RepID=UPI000C32F16C|nr:ATP-binding cassette domain-containing protein [Macromonas nakdongensis]